jgi:hypothetical protein
LSAKLNILTLLGVLPDRYLQLSPLVLELCEQGIPPGGGGSQMQLQDWLSLAFLLLLPCKGFKIAAAGFRVRFSPLLQNGEGEGLGFLYMCRLVPTHNFVRWRNIVAQS